MRTFKLTLMVETRARSGILQIVFFCFLYGFVHAQCPDFTNEMITGNGSALCEGDVVTISLSGEEIPPNSTVDFYLGTGSFDPYMGEGDFIGSTPVTVDECNNTPEILYIMVNPDNTQVGSPNDKCDEFIVMWTGSGGFSTSDIVVSNLLNGSFQWNNFVAGSATGFSCGTPLPPGPVPENAILIIMGAVTNNVFIDSDVLCASGLPVYIIANNNSDCTLGWLDNDSPCSSCPVMVDITGTCSYSFDLDYSPPGSSTNGWGWSNMSSGVFADVIPPVDVPVYQPPLVTISDFNWTVPNTFCENFGDGEWQITGILNPEPTLACPDIFTPYFDVTVSCPVMTLQGGGDICEGNCPDDPNEITFSITGTDVPFIADIIVTASVFPPFPINDLEITNGQQLFICLEGFFPSFDPGTNTLTVPVLAIGITATVQVVSIVSASGCPVAMDQTSVTLTFIEAATSNAGPDQTICSNETVNLSGSIGGSASNAEWTTDGDGSFADPNDLTTIYTPGPFDIQNGNVQITLTGTDVNGACIPAESTLDITIEQSIFIETGGQLTICNTDVANIMASITGPNEPGMWETTGDGTFDDADSPATVYTPGNLDILNGSVTLFYNPVDPDLCIGGNEPLVIDIVNAAEADLPQDLEICDDETVTITIDVSGNFTGIVWSTMGDGDLTIVNNLEVTYLPGPMDIDDQFVIISVMIQHSFAECGITTYNIPVSIIDCDCPPFQTVPPSNAICADDGLLDLSTLLISGGAGNWSVSGSPPGSNPAFIAGDNFITDASDPGIYTVTYTLDNPDPGCPSSASENIEVVSTYVPDAGAGIANCGPATVFISGSTIPFGAPDILWETLGDGDFVDPSSLATSYIPGPLDSNATMIRIVLHVIDPICGNQSDTSFILFNEPALAVFIEDTIGICNEEDKGSIVNFPSLIIDGDINGSWTNSGGAPVDFTRPDSVNFDGVAEGLYSFHYQTNSATFPCQESDYDIVISVMECQCPFIDVQQLPGGICNSQQDLSLAAFIMAGAPGTYEIFSAPPGSNPATLQGPVLQTLGADQGEYGVRFTFDSAPIDGCPDSAEIVVFIQEQPFISITGDTIACGEDDLIFHANLSGSAINAQWFTNGTGSFNNATSSDPTYTISSGDVLDGNILIVAASVDTFGFCPVIRDTLAITISSPPFAILSSGMTSVCNNIDSGSVVDFSSFIIGGDPNGTWVDTDGSGVSLSNLSSVDFDGVGAGNYEFTYTTQSAVAPCVDSSYIFFILVEDCTCPPFQLGNIAGIQCTGIPISLDNLIIDAAPGVWSVSNGPAGGIWPVIAGSILNTSNADPGQYTLDYHLNDSIPGCSATQNILFDLEQVPVFNIEDIDCDAVTMFYSVEFTTNAPNIVSDFGIISVISPGTLIVSNIPVGQNVMISLSSASGTCAASFPVSAPDCSCTLDIENLSDTILLCPGDTTVLIPFITGAQGLAFSTWIGETTVMQPTYPVFEEGNYVWIVRDSAGCEERDSFSVALIDSITILFETIEPSCNGLNDGKIVIEQIDGGGWPYTVQLDNGALFESDVPDTIVNVGVGIHQLHITDITGCERTIPISLTDASLGNVDLGPDVTISSGDSVLIEPIIEDITVANSTWDPPSIAPDQNPFWFTPLQSILIELTITDSLGCIYSDDKLITVTTEKHFYIPTVFSPNNDQVNDVAYVVTSSHPIDIQSLEIFDRWGNLVYVQKDNSPFGWDGKFKESLCATGVYVVKMIWKDADGNNQLHTSDLTLIR